MPKPRNPNKAARDAYFTPVETSAWCLSKLNDVIPLKGLNALEPAVGGGSFIRGDTFGLNWTTNELYSEFAQGFVPNYSIDFTSDKDRESLGEFDIIIGNPPFGDTASRLAKKFVKLALEMAPVVAMVLPRGCRRGRFQDSLPKDVRVVMDIDLENKTFELPEGKKKEVGCCWIVFAREEGYERPQNLDYETVGYRGLNGISEPPDWATHGIGLVHNAKKLYDVQSPDFVKGSLATYWVELKTDLEVKALYELDFDDLINRTQTSFPRLCWHEAMTYLNHKILELKM